MTEDNRQNRRSARERAIEAYEGAERRAADTLTESPLIALAGGIAAGALIAALLPRTSAEDRVVKPAARRLRQSADAAVKAARATSKERFGDMGFSRKEGEETLKACRELGISLVPYAPLGRSMLTGTVRGKADLPEGDRRLAHPRFQGEALDKNVELVKRLETIAREKRCTVPQLALAWVLAQGKDIVPIPGTKRRERIDENLKALEVKLSADDVKRISDAAPPGAGAGTRYPADGMKRVYL